MEDLFVRVVPFPNFSANGMIVSNGDGTCTILLNANTSYDMQRKAFLHELKHFVRDDLFAEKDIEELES